MLQNKVKWIHIINYINAFRSSKSHIHISIHISIHNIVNDMVKSEESLNAQEKVALFNVDES